MTLLKHQLHEGWTVQEALTVLKKRVRHKYQSKRLSRHAKCLLKKEEDDAVPGFTKALLYYYRLT